MSDMTPDGLRLDHQNADYFVFLKAHDRNGHTMFKEVVTGWAWLLIDASSYRQTLNHNIAPLSGRCYSAFPRMLLDVARRLNKSIRLHVVADQEYFINMINGGSAGRLENDYKRTSGELYADSEIWRELDEVVTRFDIQLSAGRPQSAYAKYRLDETSRHASRAARNVGTKPGDWEP